VLDSSRTAGGALGLFNQLSKIRAIKASMIRNRSIRVH
jgi:hypothetical protein